MLDPITTITASAIVSLVLEKFIDSTANGLAEKLSAEGLLKIDKLYHKICNKLKGESTEVNDTLIRLNNGENIIPENIVKPLDDVMKKDPDFAQEIKTIAHEITLEIEQIQDNSQMNQVNYGGTNYQTKTGHENTNFFGGTHNHK